MDNIAPPPSFNASDSPQSAPRYQINKYFPHPPITPGGYPAVICSLNKGVTTRERSEMASQTRFLRQIRIGINTYLYLYSASGSSGRICPADCESLNSSRTSPSLLSAFRKSRM